MTGDGINDSPALVSADIGVAMGSGTSVARNAAKMILLDDNFATIVGAVDEGRAIFNNTKSFIRYLITSNIGEVVAVAIAALIGLPEVLLSVQLLFVNLVTDGLPASALGFNKPESNVMDLAPRKKDEPIVSRQSFFRYLIGGTYVGLAVIAATLYWYLFDPSGPKITFAELRHHQKCVGDECKIFDNPIPQTMSLSVLVVVEMLCALSSVSDSLSLLVIPPWSNVYLVFAAIGSMIMHFAVLEIGFFNRVFSTTHLGIHQWTVILCICMPAVLVEELFKYSIRKSLDAAEKPKKD
jgi:magnesium-transporting ATPase (P-type)